MCLARISQGSPVQFPQENKTLTPCFVEQRAGHWVVQSCGGVCWGSGYSCFSDGQWAKFMTVQYILPRQRCQTPIPELCGEIVGRTGVELHTVNEILFLPFPQAHQLLRVQWLSFHSPFFIQTSPLWYYLVFVLLALNSLMVYYLIFLNPFTITLINLQEGAEKCMYSKLPLTGRPSAHCFLISVPVHLIIRMIYLHSDMHTQFMN